MMIGLEFLLFTASSVADASPVALETQEGYASYYGRRFDGKKTARIVDRGPSRAVRRRGVIIDLSRAAAARLALLERGRARVRVDVLSWGR
jgi:rare lipoprotein A (peptidoglycan hydrolase)